MSLIHGPRRGNWALRTLTIRIVEERAETGTSKECACGFLKAPT
jgi:hypothetical protein